jgi:type VI secretion system secreted protein Hcp
MKIRTLSLGSGSRPNALFAPTQVATYPQTGSHLCAQILKVVAVLVLLAVTARATTVYVTATGYKQGVFNGESPLPAHSKQIPVLDFTYGVVSPHDASGFVTGPRQHQPVVISKTLGAASVQFFQAMFTNERLSTVVVDFYEQNSKGDEVHTFSITLINPTMVSLTQHAQDVPSRCQSRVEVIEDISFTFEKIDIHNLVNDTETLDDWNPRA